MSFIQKWKSWKKSRKLEKGQRAAKRSKAWESVKRRIVEILTKQYGIKESDIRIDGYNFRLIYKDLIIPFAIVFQGSNYGDLFLGSIHRPPINKDEEECLKDAREILKEGPNMFREFQRYFNYRAFEICSRTELGIHKIIELAETPLREATKRQSTKTGRIEIVIQ